MTAPWGETVPNAALLDALDRHPERAARRRRPRGDVDRCAASAEASSPPRCSATTSCCLADCVTSLGGMPLEAGRWGVDYAYSCTQKCLAAPPGMAPVAISPRAWRRIAARRSPVPFALDLELLRRYWVDRPAVYHHTTPILCVYALHEALRLVVEEGLEARWARHAAAGAHLQAALRGRGLELLADPVRQMAPLTAVRVPDGVDGKAVQAGLLARRDRGRRRARAGRPADVADRADGPQRDGGDGHARARRARRGARPGAGGGGGLTGAPGWHSPRHAPRRRLPRTARTRARGAARERRRRVGLARGPRPLRGELHDAVARRRRAGDDAPRPRRRRAADAAGDAAAGRRERRGRLRQRRPRRRPRARRHDHEHAAAC